MRILLAQLFRYAGALHGGPKANRLLLQALAAGGHACRVVVPFQDEIVDAMRADLAGSGIDLSAIFQHVQSLREIEEHARGLRWLSDDTVAFEVDGVEVIALRARPDIEPAFRAALQDFDPQIVLAGEDFQNRILGNALQVAPGRVVVLAHTVNYLPFGPEAVRLDPERTAMISSAAGVITVSDFCRRYIQRWAGLDAQVLRFPVYGQGPFPSLGSIDNPFVTIINPCALKGIDIFLALAASMPEVAFAAVPTWGTTAAELTALRALDNVTVLEARADVDQIFAQTRVLLVPSLWAEAFGLVAVEAKLRGIPALVSSAGGLPEAALGVDRVIEVAPIRWEASDDAAAPRRRMVPPQDCTPWRAALGELLADPVRYHAVSTAGREAALEHVATCGAGSFAAYFEAIVARAGGEAAAIAARPRDTG